MRILIIGATGACGSRLAREAQSRGHSVTRSGRTRPRRGPTTGTSRSEESPWVTLDAADAYAVAHAARAHDVILGATRPAPGQEDDIVPVTTGLAHGARRAGVRLVVVGGAGPLRLPGSSTPAIDDPHWVPPPYRAAAAASVHQLDILRGAPGVDWTYLAPAAHFWPGERTGAYRTGGSELVIAPDGSSTVSMEDFAVAALDEIETPTTSRDLLSVGS